MAQDPFAQYLDKPKNFAPLMNDFQRRRRLYEEEEDPFSQYIDPPEGRPREVAAPAPEPEPEPLSTGEQIWQDLNKGLWQAPAEAGRKVNEAANEPSLARGENRAFWESLGGHFAEVGGGLLTQMTSPLDIAAMLATGGGSMARSAAVRAAKAAGTSVETARKAGSLLRNTQRGIGGAMMAHGAQTGLNAESGSDVGVGATEVLGGILTAIDPSHTIGGAFKSVFGGKGKAAAQAAGEAAGAVPPPRTPPPPKGTPPVGDAGPYSVMNERRARDFLREKGIPDEALTNASNKDIIDLAKQIDPDYGVPKEPVVQAAPEAPVAPETASFVSKITPKQRGPVQQQLPLEFPRPERPPVNPVDELRYQEGRPTRAVGELEYGIPEAPDTLGDVGQRSLDFEAGAPMREGDIDPFLARQQGNGTTFDFEPPRPGARPRRTNSLMRQGPEPPPPPEGLARLDPEALVPEVLGPEAPILRPQTFTDKYRLNMDLEDKFMEDALNWKREDTDLPLPAEDVADIVRDVTGKRVDIFNPWDEGTINRQREELYGGKIEPGAISGDLRGRSLRQRYPEKVLPGEFSEDLGSGQPPRRPPPSPPPSGEGVLLPPEFGPDVRMEREPIAGTGGYSPKFQQLAPDEIEMNMTRPEVDTEPLFSKVKPTVGEKLSAAGDRLRDERLAQNKRLRDGAYKQILDIQINQLETGKISADEFAELTQPYNDVINHADADDFKIKKQNQVRQADLSRPQAQQDAIINQMVKMGVDPATAQALVSKGMGEPNVAQQADAIIAAKPVRGPDGPPPAPGEVRKITTQMKVNARNSAKELTSGYSGALAGIMVREGLQNAFDAVKHLGDMGEVKLRLGKALSPASQTERDFLEMFDNGKGMSPEELLTVFSTLHESGKTKDTGATGGKGVGKATYMLGGDHFDVTTVKEIDGVKVESTFRGDPETILTKFDIESKVVDPDTPTGTRFRTYLADGQSRYEMREMLGNIKEKSRGLKMKLSTSMYGGNDFTPEPWKPEEAPDVSKTLPSGVADIDVRASTDIDLDEGRYVQMHYLNNGMYQFSRHFDVGEAVRGLPKEISVDVKPLVEELADNYPFPVQRESLKSSVLSEIEKVIKDELISKSRDKTKIDLVKLWDSMTTHRSNWSGREVTFFDPGDRLTPDELDHFRMSNDVRRLQGEIDSMIDRILMLSGEASWPDQVVRVGISLDPKSLGIYIPNPQQIGTNGRAQAAILINPFQLMLKNNMPTDTAMDMVVTGLHESAHAGTSEPFRMTKLESGDLNDPRVGKFLSTFLKEMHEQGGHDYAHGMNFMKRLGDLYGRYGTKNAFQAHDGILDILTGGRNAGEYSPEIQRLLHIYEESRGRPATTEDILSGTGVKSAAPGTGPENVPGTNRPDGGRASSIFLKQPTPEGIAQAAKQGYKIQGRRPSDGAIRMVLNPDGSLDFNDPGTARIIEAATTGEPAFPQLDPAVPVQMPKEWWKKIPGLGRAATEIGGIFKAIESSWDLSIPMRQGRTAMHTEGWQNAWKDMIDAMGSKEAYDVVMANIYERPDFKRPVDENGVMGPSFAERAKLAIGDPKNKREEEMGSSWAERFFPGVSHSNRAAAAFSNRMRADNFENLIALADRIYQDAKRTGKATRGWFIEENFTPKEVEKLNPRTNMELAEQIANYVNVSTGRGGLGKAEFIGEFMNNWVFSPRLMSSRAQLMNPKNLLMTNPMVRKEYQKSMLTLAATWASIAGGATALGATVSFDPDSPDFLKARFPNGSVWDPGAGFQQYLVLLHRLGKGLPQKAFPDTLGEGRYGKEGPYAPTPWGDVGQFARNKLSPMAAFGTDVAQASKTQPFELGDSAARLATPFSWQSVNEWLRNDPELAGLLGIALEGTGAVGTQTYGAGAPKEDIRMPPEWLLPRENDFRIPQGSKFRRGINSRFRPQ